MIPFGEWLPDRPNLENPGMTEALNVIPTAGGYAPFEGFNATTTNALDARCQGAVSFKQTDGGSFVYAGDATKLYELRNNVFTDASAKVYNVLDFNQWHFGQFGSLILAANGSDKLQKLRAGAGTNFEEIEDSPVCNFIAVVKDFVVVGPVTIDNDRYVQWSARNDVDSWEPTVNSSGIQVLIEGGPLKGMTGGDFGTVLQENTLTRMNFVGGDLVFSFDRIENARGCLVSGSIIQFGSITYYWSSEGVEAFFGTSSRNIGEGKVNKTLFNRLDFDEKDKVTATVDPERRLVMWNYPDTTAGGVPNRILTYYVGENRFSDVALDTQVLVASLDASISIDDIAGSIDDSPLTGFPTVTSLDDPILLGGRRHLAAFNTSNEMANLDGDTLAATLAIGEFIFTNSGQFISDGKKITIKRLRGAIDGTHTLSVNHRSKLQVAETVDGPLLLEDDGSTAFNVKDRYNRFEMNTLAAASWNHAQGIDFEDGKKGGR